MKKKINILHISTPSTFRGGENQLILLSRGLKSYSSINQAVLCPKNSELSRKLLDEKIKHFDYLKNARLSFNNLTAYRNTIQQFRPDIIHLHDSAAHTLAFVQEIFYKEKIPLILHRRVVFKSGKGIFGQLKYNLQTIKKYIAVSGAVKESLEKIVKQKNKIEVIYSGIELKKSQKKYALHTELGISVQKQIIGMVSALTEEKDISTFINALNKIADIENWFAVIIGDGVLKEPLKEKVKKADLQNRIKFLGYRKDAISLLKDFDLFVHCSKNEGLGTVILEAWNTNVPVISTQAGGLKELIHNQNNALAFGVGQAEELADKMKNLINSDALKDKLIKNGQDSLQKFDINKTISQMVKIYEEVLSS